jgi:hypothetical protein
MTPDLTRVVCDRIRSERLLSVEAATNPEFLDLLHADPRRAVEWLLGRDLLPTVEIEVVEMRPNRIRVTVPPRMALEGELSDSELATVAGGTNGMVREMAALNTQFQSLQDASEKESHRHQTLSDAAKAYHDLTMNAVRNTKA